MNKVIAVMTNDRKIKVRMIFFQDQSMHFDSIRSTSSSSLESLLSVWGPITMLLGSLLASSRSAFDGLEVRDSASLILGRWEFCSESFIYGVRGIEAGRFTIREEFPSFDPEIFESLRFCFFLNVAFIVSFLKVLG